jgi:ubiquinone/menaquinone biosynthesis C-methylase UbiE
MSRTYEDRNAARRYNRARTLPAETLNMWMKKVRGLIPDERIESILDLGAGTGRYSELLHWTFGGHVTALEPSGPMREEAGPQGSPEVTWAAGTAEQVPAEDCYFDLVWMSQVFHHLDDRQKAIREVRRVLRPGGHLVIRNATRENDAAVEWFACFPEAQQLDRDRMPSRRDIAAQVCAGAFRAVAEETVYQQTAPSWDDFYERVSQRAMSVMTLISDEAFERGLERLKEWVARQPDHQPVVEPVDLFVFQAV